jgi:DNA polymerase
MDKRQAKVAILRWYKTFGVDHLFCNLADSVTKDVKSKSSTAYSSQMSQQNIDNVPFETIEELKEAVFSMDCHLKKTAKNTVFSDGAAGSDVMIIGEAPGRDEDEQGKPFVGQSGKLLNLMLESVGLKRSDVYISNVIFWRPPGNRQPSADEISLCFPYVKKHILLAKPKVLFLLGGVAVKAILHTGETISRLRGKPCKFLDIDAIATFHPAYLLRSPGQKVNAFRDCIRMKKLLES